MLIIHATGCVRIYVPCAAHILFIYTARIYSGIFINFSFSFFYFLCSMSPRNNVILYSNIMARLFLLFKL